MPKTTTELVRLRAGSIYDTVKLIDLEHETNERLYQVLHDDFYLKKLTAVLEERYPSELASWVNYRKTHRDRPANDVQMIAKFNVTDQKVDFVDVRFY